ncbi:MAG TPA: class I SAM-dependent methyltransferase, partial [Gaiellaceae bacterium]|nr:class I SAM-dependent methyltransferase [Gaiellaceae bacterium]
LSFPTGELRLALCPACGFVTNTAFDPLLQDYSLDYEETQAFSPHFVEFLEELARDWVERYDLRGKRVLEIGSGKGEFLLLLHELGVADAIGVDPGFVPGRVEERPGLRFLRELYSERHAGLEPDAIVCRHTLEHIQPVGDFVRGLRASLLLFELPDVLRVLREGAFWDLYYEHASYFSPGSLARLFRSAGHEVLELELTYDDQYILIEARPGEGGRLPLEEPPGVVAQAVAEFRRVHGETESRWRERLAAAERPVIWGAGSKGVAFLTTLGAGIELAVDVNPFKQERFLAGSGVQVVAPEALREYRPDLVVAMNPVYLGEIGSTLSGLGVETHLEAV